MARPVDPPPQGASTGDHDPGLPPRQAREAAALRENLRRRKQQTRARAEPAATDPASAAVASDLPREPG